MNAALDSSALIAWLAGEPEGQPVSALFAQIDEGEGVAIYVHSVNLAEVFYHVRMNVGEQAAEESIGLILEAGAIERSDMDGVFWRELARLIADARQLPKSSNTRGNLAMGDAFGVALANRLGADFVTKDRTEIEPLQDAGLVSALFIR